MKRFLAVGLACVLLLTLSACKPEAVTPTPTDTPSPSPSETLSPTPIITEEPSPAPTETIFTFTRDNFPRLDGSTSTAPLGRAVAAALLDETEEEVSDLISFSRTTNSFRALMAGEADLLIVGEPNASVYDEMAAAGFEASIDTFATDGLIFVVNEDNPVDNLTTEQIRAIYSGKITNWSQVGGDDMPITPFQRNKDAGSQALMKKLVMKDIPLMDAPKGYIIESMMGLMEAVRSYDNSPGAIGYSVYYYANDMKMASGLKILSVDGVAPSAETIRSEEYPHRNAYYVVMAADTPENSPTARVYNWILSEEGQALVDAQGYVSVLDVSSPSAPGEITTIANRLSADPLPDFTPTKDYDLILPYVGGENSVSYYEGDPAVPSYLYGLCTPDGTILTDPVYKSIYQLTWYDIATDTSHTLPVWILTQTRQDENGNYYTAAGLAAADGAWYTGMIYEASLNTYITTTSSGVLMKLDDETAVMVGLGGQEKFRWSPDDFLPADSEYRSWFFDDGLNWILRNYGQRLYYRPSEMGLEGPDYVWLDPDTGEVVKNPVVDVPIILTSPGVENFDGGRCELDGLTVTICRTDGRETSFELPGPVEQYWIVTDEYLLFYPVDGSSGKGLLYLHDGTLLLSSDGTASHVTLLRDSFDDTAYPCLYQYDDTSGRYSFAFYNPDGSVLHTLESAEWPTVCCGLLSVVDDTSYRLTDLVTDRDLIRLPRWAGMDRPAE